MTTHKIVVTSLLRTDADIEKLMRQNSVAVKNSAHRHATTFDISYTRFVPASITTNANPHEMKKVLAEVLRDLRDAKLCYVKYEKSQNCFHITSRR
jgi:adenylosuccinate lyase